MEFVVVLLLIVTQNMLPLVRPVMCFRFVFVFVFFPNPSLVCRKWCVVSRWDMVTQQKRVASLLFPLKHATKKGSLEKTHFAPLLHARVMYRLTRYIYYIKYYIIYCVACWLEFRIDVGKLTLNHGREFLLR